MGSGKEGDVHALLKVVLIGDEGCGKTALCRSWVGQHTGNGSFDAEETRNPTVGVDVVTCNVVAQMGQVKVYMYDTAGCNRYMRDELKRSCFLMADLFVVVVDASLPQELQTQSISHHMGDVSKLSGPDTKAVVVLTKCDLLATQTRDEVKQSISESGCSLDLVTTSTHAKALDSTADFVGILNGIASDRRHEAMMRLKRDAEGRRSCKLHAPIQEKPRASSVKGEGAMGAIHNFFSSVRQSVSLGGERVEGMERGGDGGNPSKVHSQSLHPANLTARESISRSSDDHKAKPKPEPIQRLSMAFSSFGSKLKDLTR